MAEFSLRVPKCSWNVGVRSRGGMGNPLSPQQMTWLLSVFTSPPTNSIHFNTPYSLSYFSTTPNAFYCPVFLFHDFFMRIKPNSLEFSESYGFRCNGITHFLKPRSFFLLCTEWLRKLQTKRLNVRHFVVLFNNGTPIVWISSSSRNRTK